MAISENALLFISGFGILQSFFLSALIYFHPKSDSTVSKYLASYIFFLCVPMFAAIVQHFYSWQYLIFMDPFPLLAGPFLLLYVRSHKETITFRKAWPHFVLFAVYIVIDTQLFLKFSALYPEGHNVPIEIIHRPESMVRVTIRLIQMFTYFFLAGKALTAYQHSINHLYSETSEIDLSWVRWLVNGYSVLVLIMMGLYFITLTQPQQFRLYILINTATLTPYIYLVSFKGITQPTLWQIKGTDRSKVEAQIQQAEDFEHQNHIDQKPTRNINSEKANEIVAKTLELMDQQKLYRQPDLSVQHLADSLNIPAYQVSQAINEGLSKSFYDLTNGYRVEEAKRLLLDPTNKHNKILAVAFDAGFNSKTTFNTVFKKFTGQTPTEYREQHAVEVTS